MNRSNRKRNKRRRRRSNEQAVFGMILGIAFLFGLAWATLGAFQGHDRHHNTYIQEDERLERRFD